MSRLEDAVAAGRLVVTAELPTVDSGGLEAVRERAEPLAEYVDAANATDNTAAHAHASALAVAIALKQHDVEPVLQLVCRDRNRLALQADLVGGALHGVENVLCLTGDPVTAGDEPDAKPVFDLDSVQLLETARGLAEGRYLSGRTLETAPRLFLGGAETPAPPFEARVERAREKARAGARFFQLQISFQPELLAGFVAAATQSGLTREAALLPSICLARSASTLRYMDANVPGIAVPSETIERVERAADPEEACFDVAVELAAHALAQPGVAGVHLISFRHDAAVVRLCRELGIPTRTEREASGYRAQLAV